MCYMEHSETKETRKNVNREYKDSVFTDLFYEDEEAKNMNYHYLMHYLIQITYFYFLSPTG